MVGRANFEQDRLAALPATNILVIAPAGCGKTEALAKRAKALLDRGAAKAPRKILAVTFSNKARDNLAARMRKWIGPLWYRRVEVVNLHKLAARIVRAHGKVLGIATDFTVREDVWYRQQLAELRVGFRMTDAFERALREAKLGPFDDAEVTRRLEELGQPQAIEFEERLRGAGRVDYDDLLRNATRLLNVESVARLYRAHFAVTLADEIQDLSLPQFEIIRAVGGSAVTYAGDLAQGIYGFAGAASTEVFALIKGLNPELVELNLSYRSSPAVLGAVNVIARNMGVTVLESAEPDSWEDGGKVDYLESENTKEEAYLVVGHAQDILARDKLASVGIIGRRGSRLEHIRNAMDGRGVDYEDWTLATHSPKAAALIKQQFRSLAATNVSDQEKLASIESRCLGSLEPSDVDTAREISSACVMLRDALENGTTLKHAVASCRAPDNRGESVSAGIHILSGHKGKGQEFDWAFVVGLEDGHIPDFRNPEDPEEQRILHVMLSRAKYGVVLTRSRQIWSKRGWWPTEPSRWLNPLLGAVTQGVRH